MDAFFQWLYSLQPAQQAILGLLLLVVLTVIPYIGLLSRIFSLLLQRKFVPEIHFFGLNYASSEDPSPTPPGFWKRMATGARRLWRHLYAQFNPLPAELPVPPTRSAVYYTENVPEFYVEGSVAELAWEVTGAYRIDILPLHSRVKGNGMRFLFDSTQRHFVLRAYGLYGQTEAIVDLPLEKFQQLHHEPLSRNTTLASSLRTTHTQPPTWKEQPVRQPKVTGLVRTLPTQRKNPLPSGLQRFELIHTLRSTYTFSTHKYDTVFPSKKSKS